MFSDLLNNDMPTIRIHNLALLIESKVYKMVTIFIIN